MAYVYSTAQGSTSGGTAATSYSFDSWFSGQADNDVIIVVASASGSGTPALSISSSTGSWTELSSAGQAQGSSRSAVWWARRSSGVDISIPTISGASLRHAATAVLLKDADASTLLDVSEGVTAYSSNTTTPSCPSVTSTNNNCLVLRCIAMTGSTARQSSGFGQGVSAVRRRDNTGNSTLNYCFSMIEYDVKQTAGATGTYGFINATAGVGRVFTLAIRNASSGKVPCFPRVLTAHVVDDIETSGTEVLLQTLHSTLLGGTTVRDGTSSGGAISSGARGFSTAEAQGLFGWGKRLGQTQTANTGLAGVYGAVRTLASAVNFSTGLFCQNLTTTGASNVNPFYLYFRDGAGGWALIQPDTATAMSSASYEARPLILNLPTMTQADGSGTIDWTNITQYGYAVNRTQTSTVNIVVGATAFPLYRLPFDAQTVAIVGGTSAYPFDLRDVATALASGATYYLPLIQGAKQQVVGCNFQIGDGGTTNTYFNGNATALEFYGPWAIYGEAVTTNDYEFRIKAGASDSIKLGAAAIGASSQQDFVVDASSSTSATYDWGGTIFGMAPTFIDGLTISNLTLTGCGEVDAQSAVFNNCVISSTTSTDAAIAFDANSSMTGTTIDVTGTSAAYHLELGTAVTAFALTNCTFTGTPGTDKVHVKATTGTVTITLSGTTLSAGDITSDGATVVLAAPTDDLTVTSNVAGTLLQVFTTGTQTVLASTTGTSLTYTHSSETVDIVAQKAGYLPQRVTGVALSGDMTQAFTLQPDYNYDAAHGLTYTTSASWSRANNQLTVPTWGPTVRQVYSLMIDSFISETSLRNTAFNLSMNGPTTLFLTNGAEGATDASITNMTGGGVRYLSGAGATTAEFSGVLSSGVVSGSQAEYELGAGGTVVDARATGNVNEVIKVYGDATHGNFDKRNHLQFKVQRNGYREAFVDVVDSFGNLTPVLYVIGLPMVAIDGLTLGDPGITGVTVTKHGSPVSWDAGDGAKNYSITIEDSGTNSGANILRWLNYNLSLDATFQGVEPFYWPEMVLDNGAAFETLRGTYHGNPDVVTGVRVIRTGGDPHPDFTRFQSDDGTYGTPPTVATASITGILTGSKVRIYNVTTATETYINTPGTSYSLTYTDGTTYTAGDSVQVTIHKRGYLTFQTTVVASASGWAVSADQVEDDVYTTLAIDGSAVTGFAADYVNDEVNVTVAANFNLADMYAWWSYNLESDDGIRNFVGGMTAVDQANFRINNGTVDIYIDNTTATNLRQLDNRRIYRADGAYPVKSSGGGGIDVVWRNTILLAETGVSGLTPEESTLLSQAANMSTLIEGSYTAAEVLRLTAAAVAGKTSGQPTAPVFRNITDTADRITATVDTNGNRTSVTLNP